MTAWRVMPSRVASASKDATIQAGKSTLTRYASRLGRRAASRSRCSTMSVAFSSNDASSSVAFIQRLLRWACSTDRDDPRGALPAGDDGLRHAPVDAPDDDQRGSSCVRAGTSRWSSSPHSACQRSRSRACPGALRTCLDRTRIAPLDAARNSRRRDRNYPERTHPPQPTTSTQSTVMPPGPVERPAPQSSRS
jgi:hypothetical protein